MLTGIDLSSWQGAPGQWAAEAGEFDFAAVKISEVYPDGSRYADPDAAADLAWLKANGKGRILYLYAHPASSANDTAAFFLSLLDELGLDDADAVAIDLEVSDSRNAAQVSVWMKMATRKLQGELGRPVLVYVDLDFAAQGNCSGLGALPLWVADPSSPAGRPRVPSPWTTWALQQTDISGALDRDVAAFASLAQMSAALGKKVAPPVAVTRDYTTSGNESLQQVADAVQGSPAQVLRLTAVADGKFLTPVADYVNGVFAGQVAPSSPLPRGVVLKVPAS